MESVFHNRGRNKTLYFTKKLILKLEMIRDNAVTIAEAPMGYGKTSAIKYYMNSSNEKFHWINVASNSKEIFWSDFCDVFGYAGAEMEESLRLAGYPASDKAVAEVRSIIKKTIVSEHTYIIIDNYNAFADSYFDLLMASLKDVLPCELHFIILAEDLNQGILSGITEQENVLYISKEDFVFGKDDISELFKANSLRISNQDAQRLYEYSDGWISAIYLQMLNYSENGRLEETYKIDDLVEKTVWFKLGYKDRYYVTGLSVLDYFTLREAEMMMPEGYDKNRAGAIINGLIFVRFDKHTRNYYINPIFKSYLDNEYFNLSKGDRDRITVAAGKVFESRGLILTAYRNYYRSGEWELICRSNPDFSNIYPFINNEHRGFFIAISDECPDEFRKKYISFSMMMCLVLFIYNEKERLNGYLALIDQAFDDDSGDMTEKQKNNLSGTMYFIRGYTSFNSIPAMHDYYSKSLEHAMGPLSKYTRCVPFMFGSPSVLFVFHRESGKAYDEVEALNSMMPDYYKLTLGHGKGAESLFKAEMLYYEGNFEGAETLCHKALYMADSRDQTGISLGALLLLARMSIFDGDYDSTMDKIAAFSKKAKLDGTMDSVFIPMVDMCESFMYALMGNKDKIAEWLTDYSRIENRLNLISMGFANIIYARYLYLNGEHQKFLGISGQFLGVASIFSEVMAEIYTYISIAMSNLATGNRSKAVRMLDEAIKKSVEDSFIMPFVESYEYIEEIFQENNYPSQYRDFIKKVHRIAKKFGHGIRTIKKGVRSNDNYGLTARELDVAKLAAERYSNREIAEKLYIAESTVKSNLKIIFSKLDISSRTELSNFFR